MIETELKISLDPAAEARLRRNPAIGTLRVAPGRTATLVSVYYDTPGEALAEAGIALRLRREGRAWIQTIKRRVGAGTGGLFANQELECPAPGARLVLEGEDPAFAAVKEAAGGAPLSPLFETRVRRRIELLRDSAGVVELAIDVGEVVAGDRSEPILEAELELKEGTVAAVYGIARQLFPTGPIRLATLNKSARGYALLPGTPVAKPKAGAVTFAADLSVEKVARAVFRDCLDQISRNLELVADGLEETGPHQLRVGLRRLRTAISVFAPSLGAAALAPLNAAARDMGRVGEPLRDLDVLIGAVEGSMAPGLDAEARRALVAALVARREGVRAETRRVLAGETSVGFVFDLAEFIEIRGWLEPSDYEQTGRLAAPIGEVAPAMLDRRLAKARKRAKGLEGLEDEALHALRKELKNLRYSAEILAPIYPGRNVALYLRALKDLQEAFGSLTDTAMAHGWLTGPEAPGAADAAGQRAVGWLLGGLNATQTADRKRIFARWHDFAEAKPFWR